MVECGELASRRAELSDCAEVILSYTLKRAPRLHRCGAFVCAGMGVRRLQFEHLNPESLLSFNDVPCGRVGGNKLIKRGMSNEGNPLHRLRHFFPDVREADAV